MNPTANQISGCLAVTDPAGRILFCSEAFAAKLGQPAPSLLGRDVTELFGAEAWQQRHFQCGATECKLEQREVALDGQSYLRLVLLNDASQQPFAAGQQLNVAQTTQVREATHEMNNVFTALYASLDLALNTLDNKQVQLQWIERAYSAARRGGGVLDRMRQIIGRRPDGAVQAQFSLPTDAAQRTATGRILVLSTDAPLRLLLRAVLGYRGFQVLDSASSAEALRQVDGRSADLVVIDTSIAEDWKPITSRLPVLLLSAEPLGDEHPWIRKPVENGQLVDRVQALIEARKHAGRL